MEIFEAMRKCEFGGYIARKAYPNRKYHKDENGIFPMAANVDYIDFIARDWEYYPADIQACSQYPFNRLGQSLNQNRL